MSLFNKRSLLTPFTHLLFTSGILLIAQPLQSKEQLTYQSQEEAFLIRRISEFWKDKDYYSVKDQIINFIKEYPNSSSNDNLKAILGDIYLQEEHYDQALESYQAIHSKEMITKTIINKLQCYYEMANYTPMIKEGENYLEEQSPDIISRKDEFTFLMAEAFYRTQLEQESGANYLTKAMSLYEEILQSPFNDPAMFALAEIYQATKQYERAANFYNELAKRHQDISEGLNFHEGLCLAHFNKQAAINTFSKIIDNKGEKSNEAALNRLILFFQEENYAKVVELYTTLDLPKNKEEKLTYDYMIGRSYFSLNQYTESKSFLANYISSEQDKSGQYRNALLMQLNSAQALEDEVLYQNTIENLNTAFPDDSELPQALFIHAMMLKNKELYSDAEEVLSNLISAHPDFEDKETLYLEYALVAHNNQKWGTAHSTLKIFLQEFPTSTHSKVAWKYFLSSAIEMIKTDEDLATNSYSKTQFLTDLSETLKQDGIFSSTEKQEADFLQAKVTYELDQFDEAASYLSTYIENYTEGKQVAKAHLLLAIAAYKSTDTSDLFDKHAKIALEMDQDLAKKASIHLELYNIYLSLLNDNPSDSFEEAAATHLYNATMLNQIPIQEENQLWLANFYVTQFPAPLANYSSSNLSLTEKQKIAKDKASALYKSLLTNGNRCRNITKGSEYLEIEIMKLISLIDHKEGLIEKVSLLKDLIHQQTNKPEIEWKLKNAALIELAKCYEIMDAKSDALETYKFVSNTVEDTSPSFITTYAKMHKERLTIDLMNTKEVSIESTIISETLNHLKALQIKKQTSSEPLHLEASLLYAELRKKLSSKDSKNEDYLFFLHRIKDDFNSTEDPLALKYQENLAKEPIAMKLYQEHMSFIDAQILIANAQIEREKNNTSAAKEFEKKALDLLSALEENSISSFFLSKRVSQAKKDIVKK